MAIADIIILAIGIILLGLAGGFAAKSASNLTKSPDYATNDKLKQAHTYLLWCAVICLVGLFVTIVSLVLSIVFGQRIGIGTQKWVMVGLMIFVLILVFIGGVLAAMGAQKMKSSTKGSSGAYNFAIAAAVTLLLGMSILFIIYIILLFMRKPSLAVLAQQQLKSVQKALSKQGASGLSAIGQMAGSAKPAVVAPIVAAPMIPIPQIPPYQPPQPMQQMQQFPQMQPMQQYPPMQPMQQLVQYPQMMSAPQLSPLQQLPPLAPMQIPPLPMNQTLPTTAVPNARSPSGIASALSGLANSPGGQQALSTLLSSAMQKKVV